MCNPFLLKTISVHWIINLTQFLIAKASITGCYAVIYTVTPELYPTVIRNSAMGCCSMIARVGANLSCYIVLWIVCSLQNSIHCDPLWYRRRTHQNPVYWINHWDCSNVFPMYCGLEKILHWVPENFSFSSFIYKKE